MAAKPLVSFLLVNWQATAVTTACVASIRALRSPKPSEIIIFDNESTASSQRDLEALGVTVQSDPANLGFGEAYNCLAGSARGSYLAIINNDAILDPSWLAAALEGLQRTGAGVVGGLEQLGDGTTPSSETYSIPVFDPTTLLVQQCREVVPDQAVPYLTASNLLLKRELFNQVGGFDASFFAYYEDLDFCAKIAAAGASAWFIGAMKIWHRVNYSSNRHASRKYYLIFSNRYKIAAKYYPEGRWRRVVLRNVGIDLVRSPLLILTAAMLGLAAPQFRDKVVLHRSRRRAAWWAATHLGDLAGIRHTHQQRFGDTAGFYQELVHAR